jgi:hypothetical protein
MINIKALLGLTYYTSGLDKFLENFDQTHPNLSASQSAELKKYTRIFQLRDHVQRLPASDEHFWDKF